LGSRSAAAPHWGELSLFGFIDWRLLCSFGKPRPSLFGMGQAAQPKLSSAAPCARYGALTFVTTNT
jgi:hypothetical protein